MAVFKCKMCGGSLDVTEKHKIITCDFCGATQTVPAFDDERKIGLFKRANVLRFKCEFDKASGIYETIISEFPKEAEAYWGLILCKYGIEYVTDPNTKKIVPTCHRTQFASIFDDQDYIAALENADVVAKDIYKSEAAVISELQKNILDISSKEDPFDIFICYKENDDRGRTKDSVLAQDIYEKLTEKGYRVFFSRITLEDKLGSAYEPYIFAALHSSKVMLHVTTSAEHSEAVWVRNEWTRYLDLIRSGQKKTLIPVFRDLVDVYDLPDEMENLQGVDMSRLGSMQDLIRGIGKIIKPSGHVTVEVKSGGSNESAIYLGWLKKGQVYLERGQFDNALSSFESAIFCSPTPGEAYFYKMIAEQRATNVDDFLDKVPLLEIDQNENYGFAKEFASESFKVELEKFQEKIAEHVNDAKYCQASILISKYTVEDINDGLALLRTIPEDFKDTKEKILQANIAKAMILIEEVKLYETAQQIVDALDILYKLPQDNEHVIAAINIAKHKLEVIKQETKKNFYIDYFPARPNYSYFCQIIDKYNENTRIAKAFEPDDEEINIPCREANTQIVEEFNKNVDAYIERIVFLKECKLFLSKVSTFNDPNVDFTRIEKAVNSRRAVIIEKMRKQKIQNGITTTCVSVLPLVLLVVLAIIVGVAL